MPISTIMAHNHFGHLCAIMGPYHNARVRLFNMMSFGSLCKECYNGFKRNSQLILHKLSRNCFFKVFYCSEKMTLSLGGGEGYLKINGWSWQGGGMPNFGCRNWWTIPNGWGYEYFQNGVMSTILFNEVCEWTILTRPLA